VETHFFLRLIFALKEPHKVYHDGNFRSHLSPPNSWKATFYWRTRITSLVLP